MKEREHTGTENEKAHPNSGPFFWLVCLFGWFEDGPNYLDFYSASSSQSSQSWESRLK